MESRTIPAYTAVFNLLKDVCPNLNPQVIQSDWELAQQRAWQEVFPSKQFSHQNVANLGIGFKICLF